MTSVEPSWLRNCRLTRIISGLATSRTPSMYRSNPSNSSNKTRVIRRSTGRLTGRVRWRLHRIRSLIVFAAKFLVSGDDAQNERMADHVAPGELDNRDSVHGLECPVGFDQSRMTVRRQVDLGFVAGDARLRAVAEPGEK